MRGKWILTLSRKLTFDEIKTGLEPDFKVESSYGIAKRLKAWLKATIKL